VSRDQNEFGTPVLRCDEHLWEREKGNLKYTPVILTRDQMRFIESTIAALCDRGYWKYHTCAAGPDHVHNVLTSEHDPESVRRLLKRWLGQELTVQWPRAAEESPTWWAECGSIRWIADDAYFRNATRYVTGQRASPHH
jgi:REP element-mobilizing transposase RayT